MPKANESRSGQRWTMEELREVLKLYPRLNFGQFTGTNQKIVQLAHKLGRTPGAVAMKLCNFASLDESLTQAGLSGCSSLDRLAWRQRTNSAE